MNNVNSMWLRDIPQSDLEAINNRRDLVRSSTILDTLGEIIKKEMEGLQRSPPESYDSPAWAYREADRNGQYKALQLIYSLTKRN